MVSLQDIFISFFLNLELYNVSDEIGNQISNNENTAEEQTVDRADGHNK